MISLKKKERITECVLLLHTCIWNTCMLDKNTVDGTIQYILLFENDIIFHIILSWLSRVVHIHWQFMFCINLKYWNCYIVVQKRIGTAYFLICLHVTKISWLINKRSKRFFKNINLQTTIWLHYWEF